MTIATTRPVLLNVRASAEERDALHAAARAEGLTLSDLVRRALAEHIGRRTN